MQHFTNDEMGEVHFVYGVVYDIGRATARLCAKRYRIRCLPLHQMFESLYWTLWEYGTIYSSRYDTGWPRATLASAMEEVAWSHVKHNPGLRNSIPAASAHERVRRLW
ncbi:hypothetical protein AVEN_122678-1 [Araneus ventricosus]|nr:hypothetical protein AVEN_44641-1 [Araneus ventricosus]GBO33945.1 hypothetical protein AVEN_122678-1 [Araneus ventricosus]